MVAPDSDKFEAALMKRFATVVLGVGVLTVCLRCSLSAEAEPSAASRTESAGFSPPARELFRQGRFVYQKNCLVCHGRFGEGDGELVRDWDVQPRNFTKARFKYRSTPYGKLPTDDDLKRTVRHGVAGTAMPIFDQLTENDLRAVVEYIKFFSTKWREAENFADPVSIPAEPEWFSDVKKRANQAAYGRVLFEETCAPCHGNKGAGDGIAAKGLKDADGKPIQPADLHPPLKCGKTPTDVYRTIMTGITGTPMMGFEGSIAPDQVWQLVAFVTELKSEDVDPSQGE